MSLLTTRIGTVLYTHGQSIITDRFRQRIKKKNQIRTLDVDFYHKKKKKLMSTFFCYSVHSDNHRYHKSKVLYE